MRWHQHSASQPHARLRGLCSRSRSVLATLRVYADQRSRWDRSGAGTVTLSGGIASIAVADHPEVSKVVRQEVRRPSTSISTSATHVPVGSVHSERTTPTRPLAVRTRSPTLACTATRSPSRARDPSAIITSERRHETFRLLRDAPGYVPGPHLGFLVSLPRESPTALTASGGTWPQCVRLGCPPARLTPPASGATAGKPPGVVRGYRRRRTSLRARRDPPDLGHCGLALNYTHVWYPAVAEACSCRSLRGLVRRKQREGKRVVEHQALAVGRSRHRDERIADLEARRRRPWGVPALPTSERMFASPGK